MHPIIRSTDSSLHLHWHSILKHCELRHQTKKVTFNAGLYHYASNNPIRYIDPDGRFLIKTENAEKVALSNKSFLFSIQAYTEITQSFDDGTKFSAEITYKDKDKNAYIMGLPVDIKVYGTDGSTLLRRRTGEYDSNGQLVELHQYYSETGYITNRLTYDKYGNISSVVDNQGATISYKYDGAENMFPTEISQYGKDTDTYTGKVEYYIDTQTKAIETDCNGNTMTYKYDGWQRISKIFTAYDGETPAVSYIYHNPIKDIDGKMELWYAVTDNKVSYNQKLWIG